MTLVKGIHGGTIPIRPRLTVTTSRSLFGKVSIFILPNRCVLVRKRAVQVAQLNSTPRKPDLRSSAACHT